MNDVSWGALALSLTVLGGIYTWWALRHRGVVASVRAAGLTLLPVAAWLTGLLQVFGEVGDALGHWLTRLVFDPTTWLGIILAVVAFVLVGGANMLGRRGEPRQKPRARRTPEPKAVAATAQVDPLIDDEIQAILKKRGIS